MVGKMVHSKLVRQIEYLKVENQILRSKAGKRISLTHDERQRLIKFGLALGADIKRLISIVNYSTFRRWVRGRKNDKPTTERGRPKTAQDIRELVVRLARENHWGYTRILGELKKLRITMLSRNTIKNILREHGLLPANKRAEDTWDKFVKRHFKTLWACDFFTKTVWTMFGPKTFHVLFFIHVHTRKVHIAGFTKHPTQQWVARKTKTISFLFDDDKKKLFIRDRDNKYPKEFDELLRQYHVKVRKIPYRSPNLNPYAEGWVGTIKRECLDHFVVFGERHFKYLVKEYVKYYNTVRPHSGLNNMPIAYRTRKTTGKIKCNSRLGGVLRHYYRE
jgi:putative transposase